MATFGEFIQSIQADGNDGQAFEHFCKWFLLNDPYWKTQVDKAWLWDEWPDRWGPDCGIDLIFKHKNGETWAIQAKCYDEKYSVTKDDINAFLTESNRAIIQHRLLLASTNGMSTNGKRACAGQEKPVTLYMLKDFEAAQVEYPSHISELASAKTKAKPTPDPHQVRAIDDVVSKFESHDRGQLIMACGTGKTFTTLWITEALAAQTTLVLVPSLNLLSQTLNEWAFAAKDNFDVLCVCSDKSVGKRDKEDMALGEAPFSVTSDLTDISNFLSGGGQKVIFCTYQSSDLIADVQSDKSIQAFDLVIADEAHRCSGKSDAAFSKVLDGEAIRATKRLFTTATPRLYSNSVKKAAADRGVEVYGMDDEAVFGPVLHTLTFGQAITEDLLNDYQVVIVGVDQPMIKGWIENQELVALNPDNQTDARTLAAKIGLLKAIKDYDLNRVISFHSRVNSAQDFASEVTELVDLIEPHNRPQGSLWASHVSGTMRTTDRISEIGKLKSLENADIGLLANARCLSEGVDVPSLDGIAFIDPRGSQVDIIQAVGRAIRKVRGAAIQTKGTIVLPVFIEDGDDAEAQIEASNFKPVWDVLKALRSHDEVLAENLDQYRTNMAKRLGTTSQTVDDRIIFDLPITVDPNFSSALRTVLVEATTASWEFWFGLMEEYVEEFGDTLVSKKFKTKDGYQLGNWVAVNRELKKKSSLKFARVDKLNSISFIWEPLEFAWLTGIHHLEIFVTKNSHAKVPAKFISQDGFKLGQWVGVQRVYKETLINERITQLNNLGFIWDQLEYEWQIGIQHLQTFITEHSHSRVPANFLTEDGFKLGNWVANRRHRKSEISSEKLAILDQLGFIWDPYDYHWKLGIQHLTAFFEEHNHAKVPTNYRAADKFKLGQWVSVRRSKKELLSNKRIAELDKLGFVWNPHEEAWLNGIKQLNSFVTENSHARVPQSCTLKNGYKLGQWVSWVRSRQEKLSQEKLDLLSDLGFDWNPLEDDWQTGVHHLRNFVVKNSHAKVPSDFKAADGFKLGRWVIKRRGSKESLLAERVVELDKLGFVWNILEDNWQIGFTHLKSFVAKNSHAKVPKTFIQERGYKLGQWVSVQRRSNTTLSKEKIALLDSLGFVWNTLEENWQIGCKHLRTFVAENSHAKVPQSFRAKNGYKLGAWVSRQRGQRDKLSPEHIKKLEALGFVWDVSKTKSASKND